MEKGGNTILMDAYNANPTSMKAALETLQLMEGKSKVAILGDMFELGEDSANEHADIGTFTDPNEPGNGASMWKGYAICCS